MNTFAALGLDTEYATLGQFFKAISQPHKREEGPKFVRATKNFIQQLNKNPERCKLKDKNELKEAFTIITTVDSVGDQDTGPTRKFICIDNWDEKEDGPLDMSKVCEEVWFGKTVKGCWQTSGREGVYTRKSIANKILENRTEISDGKGPFAANREKKIREAFSKGREEKLKKVLLYYS